MNDGQIDETAGLPLHGTRILDATDQLGELAGRILADLGAEVIRVEPPGGASSRTRFPLTPDGESLWFHYRNANKGSITVDPASSADLDRLRALVAASDVWLDSTVHSNPSDPWSAGLHDAGFGAAQLMADDPELIVCSITPCGQTGPYAGHVHTDDTLFAMSGWLTLSGVPEQPPLLFPNGVAGDIAGIVGAYATLVGLWHRATIGGGQHLDVSAFEAIAQCNSWQVPNMTSALNAGRGPINQKRQGAGPLYPAHRTADGMVRLVVLSPTQWDALWEWMGKPEEFADDSWREIVTRYINADVLNMKWAEFFADKSAHETGIESQRRGCVIAPMLRPGEALDNEHYAARGTFTQVPVGASEATFVSGFMEAGGARLGIRQPAPPTGADNAASLPDRTERPAPDGTPPGQPLGTLRVVDFGHGGVGVEAARMLADYGARVIKVESRNHPDFIRVVLGGDITESFASSSRNKRSLGVDLRTDEGQAIVHRLIADADVVIENNGTGAMPKLGMGWDELQKINPNLVMVSSQLMGSHGPWAEWIGYGPTIQALAGLSWLWDFDDDELPVGSTAIHPDHMAGRVASIAAMAGLLHRRTTGSGEHYELAQVENLMGTLAEFFAAESIEAGSVRRKGNDQPDAAPWGVFPCKGDDAWAVICVRHDTDWKNLCAAMGGGPANPAWDAVDSRLADRGLVNHAVMEFTFDKTPQEVAERCQAHGVPAAPMLTAGSMLDDPHLAYRNAITPIDQPGIGPMSLEGPAFRGSAMPEPRCEPAPLLAEHTRDICAELGLSPDEVDDYLARGILQEYSA